MGTLVQLEIRSLPDRILWDPPLTDDEFEAFAIANDLLHLERTKDERSS